jgi:glycosyltransferase involved in cell wall biosynthesis
MTPAPQISVVINNYNYGRFLATAIDSALAQRDVRAEIIVVDDGSTDRSAEVIRGYGSRITPIFQPNMGQAAAINAGVARSRAPLIAFLDADDWWSPDKLSRVLAAHAAAPRAGLIYHRLQPSFSDGKHAFAPIPRSLCSGEMARHLLRSGGLWPFPMTSSLTVTRAAWSKAGDIPDSFRISADAWITGIVPFLGPVVALPDALGAYRIHDNAWYRARDDRDMLMRRVAHWQETVRVTNLALTALRLRGQVRLRDHFDHQVAVARLGHPDAPGPLRLLGLGLRNPGEPNLARRLRGTLRALIHLRRDRAQLAEVVRPS